MTQLLSDTYKMTTKTEWNSSNAALAENNAILTTNSETLCGIEAFRRLSKEQRRVVARLCHCRQYTTGQQVVTHHDSSREVYFVVSGQLQVIIFAMNGKQVIFEDINSGEMFGELSAIDGQPRSAFVVAMTDTRVCSMSHDDFWQVLRAYPEVAESTMQRLTGMVRLLCERIFEISTLPVKDRIHAELLRLALQHMRNDDNSAIIEPAPTHADIACHIGSHREAVSRGLVCLRKKGMIERRGNKLIIHNVAQLREIVHKITGVDYES
jgi:CRP-like cAMP-binding protein